MKAIMFFRGELSEIHKFRNAARKAVDDKDLDGLERSLREIAASVAEMMKEVEHQKKLGA